MNYFSELTRGIFERGDFVRGILFWGILSGGYYPRTYPYVNIPINFEMYYTLYGQNNALILVTRYWSLLVLMNDSVFAG